MYTMITKVVQMFTNKDSVGVQYLSDTSSYSELFSLLRNWIMLVLYFAIANTRFMPGYCFGNPFYVQ